MITKEDEKLLSKCYVKFYQAMIDKSREAFEELLDSSFLFYYMTGRRQTASEFINSVMDGTLNCYEVYHESLYITMMEDSARLFGKSEINTEFFGGIRRFWNLCFNMVVKKTSDGDWKISYVRTSAY